MRTILTISFVSLLAIHAVAEQVGGTHLTRTSQSPPLAKWQRGTLKAPSLASTKIMLPPTVLTAAAGDDSTAGIEIVGYVEPVDPALVASWQWQPRNRGGEIAAVRLASPGACGLRFRFTGLEAASEFEIRFANKQRDVVYGPFVAPPIDERGGWWSPTVWDDDVHIELFAPRGWQEDMTLPHITDVAYIHGGGDCNTTPSPVEPCENDISCFPSWKNNEGRAVALFYNIREGVCARWSGALLNRGPGDFSPLFMTSRFAVGTQTEAASVEVYWDYESSSCNGSVAANPSNQPRNAGAIRVKGHQDSDWSLLGLLDPPAGANPFFLGWNSGAWSSGEEATTVHHPGGSHKRISFGDSGVTGQTQLCLFSPFIDCFTVRHRRIQLDDGRTEIGSTGAPVMDSNRQVRLVISGRESDFGIDCSANNELSYGGRFDLAFDNLKFALSDTSIASPVFVSRIAIGDPNNDGGTEQGTSGAPFNTIHEASFVVRSADVLQIVPGPYNERFKIYRPMKLVRQGSSGVVRIGD
ncbi:MAG: hypothetical protein AB7N71_07375 [Phycisphaerae bacterium]